MRPIQESDLPYRAFDPVWRARSAKGSGFAVHLIHRGAVPLPLKGKDNSAPQIKARLRMSGATLPPRGERSVAALSGGAKPIAARRCAAWGGLEGFTPPHH